MAQSWYLIEQAEAAARRNAQSRVRDDSPGFPGQADWPAGSVDRPVQGPDENPADDYAANAIPLQRDAIAAAIKAGTAPAALRDRAAKLVPLLLGQGIGMAEAMNRAALTVANSEVGI